MKTLGKFALFLLQTPLVIIFLPVLFVIGIDRVLELDRDESELAMAGIGGMVAWIILWAVILIKLFGGG